MVWKQAGVMAAPESGGLAAGLGPSNLPFARYDRLHERPVISGDNCSEPVNPPFDFQPTRR